MELKMTQKTSFVILSSRSTYHPGNLVIKPPPHAVIKVLCDEIICLPIIDPCRRASIKLRGSVNSVWVLSMVSDIFASRAHRAR